MKKISIGLISMLLFFSLNGCGGGKNADSLTDSGAKENVAVSETGTSAEDTYAIDTADNIAEDSETAPAEPASAEAASDPTGSTSESDSGANSKIAVVYFSATGTTKAVAETLAEENAADLYEIIPADTYTDADLKYTDDNCRANKEQNDPDVRPEISNDLSATTQYDTIYLGYPIWWGTAPRIIQTYLEQYDLGDAEIHTFCTSGSSGVEKSLSDLRGYFPSLNIVDGKRMRK